MGNLVKLYTPAIPPTAPTPATGGKPPSPAYCVDVYQCSSSSSDGGFIPIVDENGDAVGFMGIPPHSHSYCWKVPECHPAVAGVPGTPAGPGSGGVPADLHPGWNAGATSIAILGEHNGMYRFKVPGGTCGAVTGFNTSDEGAGYKEINYAFYVASGTYQIMENGVTAAVGTLRDISLGTVTFFQIERIEGVVRYSLFDETTSVSTPVYTSPIPCWDSLFVDASLYLGDDHIDEAELQDFGPSKGPNPLYLGNLVGFVSATGDPDVHAELRGLIGVAEGDGGPTEDPPTITPPFSITMGTLQNLQGFSIGVISGGSVGELYGVLGPLRNYASDYDYHEIVGVLDGLHLRGSLVSSHGGLVDGYREGARDAYHFLGIARTGPLLGMHEATLHGDYAFAGYGGASTPLDGELPTPTFMGAGTTTILGRLDVKAPKKYALTARGTTSALGRLDARYRGNYDVVAFGGGWLKGTIRSINGAYSTGGAGSGLGGGTTGAVGRLRATCPRYEFEASGSAQNFGGAHGVLGELQPGNAGVLVVTGPRYHLRGVGHVDVTVEYEGYSITLTPNPEGGNELAWVSHYTVFPFDRIVRFGNKHYGVAADGLYLLGGDTFDGDPIVATWRMAIQDHGKPEFKRGVSVYLTGRVSADMDVTVITDEKDSNVYKYKPQITGAGTARVLIGKGIRAHYWAYQFSNTAGEDFTIDDVTPLVAVTKRNV